MQSSGRRVSVQTLGCARNEVDSEELATRLAGGGWALTDDDAADVLLINTCGFVESAKKDSIDTVLAAADTGKKVVAVGCLAERYGRELAASLPEADAVLGFDSYADIADRLDDVMAGRAVPVHAPRDRRTLLPITPAHRPAAAVDVAVPGHAWLPAGTARTRLDDSATAYVKIASGCDRRCSFCAIPSFRGAYVSRPPADVLAEARWLASTGARELVLVSENSTSYGKDLGDLAALERLLPELAGVDGIARIRIAYLQPAELRPGLLEAIATTPNVAPYFDLSFQHSAPDVLRRMKRFGSTDAFLELLQRVRALAPEAGVRSNVIVGFPGETEDDLAELQRFLVEAQLDAIGVFGYSDEDGTSAADLEDKLEADEIDRRVSATTTLVDELMAQRAEDRVGTSLQVLVEEGSTGRAAHQGPETDGNTTLVDADGTPASVPVGRFVPARAIAADGVDLIAAVTGAPW